MPLCVSRAGATSSPPVDNWPRGVVELDSRFLLPLLLSNEHPLHQCPDSHKAGFACRIKHCSRTISR